MALPSRADIDEDPAGTFRVGSSSVAALWRVAAVAFLTHDGRGWSAATASASPVTLVWEESPLTVAFGDRTEGARRALRGIERKEKGDYRNHTQARTVASVHEVRSNAAVATRHTPR